MSVIVKGMEMPKNCKECKMWSICECLNDFEDFESICYAVEDGDLVRDKNCPLIELPPHGRLGDLDKLMTEFMDSDLDHLQRDDWREVIQIVADAQTIIGGSET